MARFYPDAPEKLRCALGTPCMICGERVPYEEGEHGPKICDKCKAAVLEMRKRMEAED